MPLNAPLILSQRTLLLKLANTVGFLVGKVGLEPTIVRRTKSPTAFSTQATHLYNVTHLNHNKHYYLNLIGVLSVTLKWARLESNQQSFGSKPPIAFPSATRPLGGFAFSGTVRKTPQKILNPTLIIFLKEELLKPLIYKFNFFVPFRYRPYHQGTASIMSFLGPRVYPCLTNPHTQHWERTSFVSITRFTY